MQHLIILHGALGSADQFQSLAGLLNNLYKIHVINFYGHGGATDIEHFSIEKFADQVFQYLTENDIEKANIVGYSMGGYVALYLAKLHSQRINKIFTLATKFHWTPAIAEQETKLLNPEKIAEKLPAFAQALEKRHAPNDWKALLTKTAKLMIDLGNHPSLDATDFQKFETPVLIGIGDKDNMVSLEETIEVYRKLKNANLLVLPATPHPIEKVNVKRLAAEISLFFN
ncbi:MAG TPA: alpha/beta fold hydrolase [Bacteroidia bacterium]|nr:alpha/beta fold hydrolase [Bacteroidia bacterium]